MYRIFKEKFKEVDRVVDSLIERSRRFNNTVYIDREIFGSYPARYWEYYATTRGINVQPKSREHVKRESVYSSAAGSAIYNSMTIIFSDTDAYSEA